MQKLNFDALIHNALYFKSILSQAKLCAVVKNNAYGHGLTHTARYLQKYVDCFAVGSVHEARQISNLNKDVLILLPQNFTNACRAVESDYILTVDSLHTLNVLIAASKSARKSARAHIKIDSGMSRLGFDYDGLKQAIALLDCAEIDVSGVYSHFYGNSLEDCDKQLDVFDKCFRTLESALNCKLTKHIANTSGALLSSKYHLDMVRIGLGLYGYGNEKLTAVKSVYGKVIALRRVRRGEVVGYGAAYRAKNDVDVAVIDVGYANGFSRKFVGSSIMLNGSYCKVVAVCMGMTMADVSDVNVCVGDVATLFGDGVNIANDDVSVYEILCNLR